MFTEDDIYQYLSAISTLIIAVELGYRKREVASVCDNIAKRNTSKVVIDLVKGVKKSKTPKATIRMLYREMKAKYKASGFDWTTAGE